MLGMLVMEWTEAPKVGMVCRCGAASPSGRGRDAKWDLEIMRTSLAMSLELK